VTKTNMTISRFSLDPGKWPLGIVWLVFFVFTASLAFFVQLWFLPTFLPGSVSEHGLLLATDSLSYHTLAAEMAEQVHQQGWTAWTLFPRGWFMVGFTAVVYVLTAPEPWVMIPVNAVAHATCGVALLQIALCFTNDRRTAFLAALPYMLFPSAAFFYTQLLKDGLFNMGLLLFLSGWVYLIRSLTRGNCWKPSLVFVLPIFAGFAVFGAVRPYMLTIANVASFFVILVGLSVLARALFHKAVSPPLFTARIIVILSVYGMQLLYPPLFVEATAIEGKSVTMNARSAYAGNALSAYDGRALFGTGIIPKAAQRKLQAIAGTRKAYIIGRPDALSTIDRDVFFNSATDIAAYVPRALQIIFFAPFPDMWFGKGSTPASTIMRRVSMLEMVISYGIMLGLPISLWAWRRRAEMWALSMFCSSVMLVYGLASPNVGTIYRVRYGYLMVFLALGVLGWRRLRERK